MNISVQSVNDSREQSSELTKSKSTHIEAVREVGKMDRRALTDAIQQFVGYTDPSGEGSTKPSLGYINMTKMIYAPFGLNVKQKEAKSLQQEARDTFTETELTYLQMAERTAADILFAGMEGNHPRGEIKAMVRQHIHRAAGMLKSIQKLHSGQGWNSQ